MNDDDDTARLDMPKSIIVQASYQENPLNLLDKENAALDLQFSIKAKALELRRQQQELLYLYLVEVFYYLTIRCKCLR